MTEYFIVANTYAAPFFSDTSHSFERGDTPRDALDAFVASHLATLYAAVVYESADAFHKEEKALAQWLSEKAIKDTAKQ